MERPFAVQSFKSSASSPSRGVRLKGYGYSLKRSSALFGDDAPEYLEKVETLNIFGIGLDYMRQFKEYLEEEGLSKDDDWLPFCPAGG